MRLACVFVPQIALQAALRSSPQLRGTAVALIENRVGSRRAELGGPHRGGVWGPSQGPHDADRVGSRRAELGGPHRGGRVVIVSVEARRAGVRSGLTAAQAAAICPGLTLIPIANADIAAAEAAIGDLGFAFAPRIDREPGRIFFEIGDLGQLYPSEMAVTQAIQARALRVGLGVRVAIAARKGIARIATRATERTVVPTGHEAAFLAPLPLRVLGEPLAVRITEAFDRWGLRTVGALAKLPAADVGLRLGADGARLHQLARGEDDEPFLPALPADAVEEGIDLDDAIVELEPLAFVLRGLFDRLLARLGCRGLACAGITLRFQLENRSFDVREVNLAAPTREGPPILQLARLDLTRRPPDAPIVAVLVVARPARARTAQLDFLRPAGPAPDRLAATIARLGALCGPDNVGAPHVEDTWREEAVSVAVFALTDGTNAPRPPTMGGTATAMATVIEDGVRALTIRRYRPPEKIEVMLGPDGPSALRGKETTVRILIAAGPYRLSGEWWDRGHHRASDATHLNVAIDQDPATLARDVNRANDAKQGSAKDTNGFSRDYWDVHASDGALYRLHHDRHDDHWYLDGYYD